MRDFAAEVTPVILTRNEEANIGRTIAQLTWAAEVVVVDSFSSGGDTNQYNARMDYALSQKQRILCTPSSTRCWMPFSLARPLKSLRLMVGI